MNGIQRVNVPSILFLFCPSSRYGENNFKYAKQKAMFYFTRYLLTNKNYQQFLFC